MVSTINGAASDNIQLMMSQMFQKMQSADTDGISGLSKSELSSIDSSNDAGGTAFLKSLTNQFDKLDSDGDGQLSKSEIASAKPPEGGPNQGGDAKSKIEDLLEKLLQEALQAMASSTSGTASTSSDSATTESASSTTSAIKPFDLSTADTDGTEGVSLSELKSVDTSNDTKKANFINDLVKNFDSIDSNGDGQLSKSEVKAAMPPPPQQQTTTADNYLNNSLSNFGDSFSKLSSNFIQKLINTYQSGSLRA